MAEARAGWRRPPRLRPSEYVDRDLIVPKGPLQGTQWTCHAFQREILDAFDDPLIEEVVVMGSSQWGKTSIACGLVAYHMAHDPCSIMVVSATEDPMAKAFAHEDIEPLIRSTPSLAAVVDPRRNPHGTNTTLLKTFRGGVLALVGANSAASLASRAIRVLVLDEVDRYPPELAKEGSPLRRGQAPDADVRAPPAHSDYLESNPHDRTDLGRARAR